MGAGKQELVVAEPPKTLIQLNPIVQIQSKFKELEIHLKTWLSKQSLPVEAAVVTAGGAAQGALIGALMGTLTQDMPPSMLPQPAPGLDPKAMASLQQAQALSGGPFAQARNFAVMTGVNVGISCVLKRIKGKEDVWSSMIAAFGSGSMFALVSGMGGPNQIPNMISSGVFFALAQGGIYKLGEKFSKSQVQEADPFYVKTRSMLFSLGLQSYEKNFKKGLLNDRTLPLLTDSALRDVNIPPGPRLLILDQIERDPELKERRRK
ncbi:chloroplastic import inner membrane translocase subunit HP30-2-like [Amaranthus tricolor]|uniref:chloroplastic import inner membrane translocase subunit HP30-2-like n=1 Tax=Amaranthus tricolor TaxID=29722 RepID=UPI00258BA955|nr:chloroplastic import inner membrane translocase subunit HP30-2-like [Amaranthus tricolor]XP_057535712.1 chloroplastic import inner membrane translocase subunit HP30-2-like [Amaranthus tricolor]XP_057535781.1 chloroplastic import inner membrane translocase subunit HP30-2-like [Amaranthus tricolor]